MDVFRLSSYEAVSVASRYNPKTRSFFQLSASTPGSSRGAGCCRTSVINAWQSSYTVKFSVCSVSDSATCNRLHAPYSCSAGGQYRYKKKTPENSNVLLSTILLLLENVIRYLSYLCKVVYMYQPLQVLAMIMHNISSHINHAERLIRPILLQPRFPFLKACFCLLRNICVSSAIIPWQTLSS